MKRFDASVSAEPRHVSVTENAIGAGVGLAVFVGLCCALMGVDLRYAWRPVAVVFVVPLALAGVGALVRVIEFVIPQVESRVGFDINGDGSVGENIRIIPVHHNQNVSMSGSDSTIDAQDLRYMIERLDMEAQSGWSTRDWVGEQLPSGKVITGAEAGPYRQFIEILEKCGALTGRTERVKGSLRMSSDEILERLRL